MKVLSLLLLLAILSFGQTFDVATIRAVEPINIQAIAASRGTISLPAIGMKVDGNQVKFGYMTLRDLVMTAYEVKQTQVTAPDWMLQQRYDISALMPDGADQKQIPAMLQALLKERFKLVARKDSKEQTVFALEVAKGGHKMKEAPPLDPNAAPAAPDPKATTINSGGQQIAIQRSGTGASITSSANGAMKMSMGPDGQMHMEVERMTMQQLADQLTPMSEFPVVDRTGLTGAYSVTLDLSMSEILNAARKTAALSGVNLPNGIGAPAGGGAPDPGGDIAGTVAKLGLRMEKTKVAMDSVTVESAERNPTEN